MGITTKFIAITSALGGILRSPPRIQYAVLPCRRIDGELRFLLVTSRESGRWVVPKGWPRSDGEAVLTVIEEAWEEAGIRGRVFPDPVGSYIYEKNMDGGYQVTCKVVVFSMAVETLLDEYPEAGTRTRKWMSAAEAASSVDEPDLATLFLNPGPELAS
jgi:8-oxo-dGTP pyrophosphatase MutT (NUDIX family)